VTSYTLNGLEANTEYTFSVYAYNDVGSGKVSAGVIAKTAIGAPTPPAGLVAKPGSTTASLTWTPSNDGGSPITWFAIETYSAATGTWTTAGTSTSPSITLTGLASGANYMARVRANNALGASSASKSVSFTTDAGAPDVPTGLTVVKVTDGSATVAWNPVSSTSPNLAVSYIVSFAIESSTLMQHANCDLEPTCRRSKVFIHGSRSGRHDRKRIEHPGNIHHDCGCAWRAGWRSGFGQLRHSGSSLVLKR
jgi:predicted phage tail protein